MWCRCSGTRQAAAALPAGSELGEHHPWAGPRRSSAGKAPKQVSPRWSWAVSRGHRSCRGKATARALRGVGQWASRHLSAVCLRERGEVSKGGCTVRAGRGAQGQCQAWVVLSSELPGAPHSHTPREAWVHGYSSSWVKPRTQLFHLELQIHACQTRQGWKPEGKSEVCPSRGINLEIWPGFSSGHNLGCEGWTQLEGCPGASRLTRYSGWGVAGWAHSCPHTAVPHDVDH